MNGPPGLARRLAGVRLVTVDVDGVLTDGTLYYSDSGELIKGFHARDGLGLQLLMDAGIEVAVLSARQSAALVRRVEELGVRHFHAGCPDKGAALAALAGELGLGLEAVAFAGDDLPDLAAFARVGVPIAVADAHPSVRAAACWVTRSPGGRGAVREIADAILSSRAQALPREVAPSRDFQVVIPARYASARLPGKPLRTLAGRPLVEHVWQRAVASGAREVLVAADDDRIVRAVEAFGGRALRTAASHESGTDRVAEVLDREGWPDDAIVVNLQGDEPFVPGDLVADLARGLGADPGAEMATLATPIRDPKELVDPSVVKVVLDGAQRALYFSRAPIPWVRDAFAPGAVPGELPAGTPFLRHLGLYAYRAGALRRLREEKPHPLELAERLEQLRALAAGLAIHVRTVDPAPERGVDTEEDLARAERRMSSLYTARASSSRSPDA